MISTDNQYSVIAFKRAASEKEYIYITESLRYIPETNTTL